METDIVILYIGLIVILFSLFGLKLTCPDGQTIEGATRFPK